jgi:hypothetical protein
LASEHGITPAPIGGMCVFTCEKITVPKTRWNFDGFNGPLD